MNSPRAEDSAGLTKFRLTGNHGLRPPNFPICSPPHEGRGPKNRTHEATLSLQTTSFRTLVKKRLPIVQLADRYQRIMEQAQD
jgi:hypothetical protein